MFDRLKTRRSLSAYEQRKREFEAARAAGQCIQVRRGEIRNLVAERLRAALGEFERVRDNRFVAPTARPGEFRVVQVIAYKGQSYGLEWGRSLPYVPDERGRLHRTAKSARLDLWTEGDARAHYWDLDVEEPFGWYILPEIDGLVAEATERAPAFWVRTATPAGVADEARAQIADPNHWRHEPRQEDIARLAAQQPG